jgi:hypothetical protein
VATAPTPVPSTVGQILTAPYWNSEVAAAVIFLANVPTFRVFDTTGQTIGTTLTTVGFAQESYDSDGQHAPSANQIVIVTPGIWSFQTSLEYGVAGVSGQSRDAQIRKGGSIVGYSREASVTSASQSVQAVAEIACVAGDVITVTAIQGTSGALGTNAYSCVFSGKWISKS